MVLVFALSVARMILAFQVVPVDIMIFGLLTIKMCAFTRLYLDAELNKE